MFFVNIRFQLAALFFFVVIFKTYLNYKKLPLLSTKCFSRMLVFTMINLFLDIATVYTINNIDTISPIVNRMAHQLFIASLDISTYYLFLYVFIIGNKQRKPNNLQAVLFAVPLAVSLFVVVIGDLDYNINDICSYSYGSMAVTVYISVAIYMFSSMAILFFPHFSFSPKNVSAVIFGSTTCIAFMLFQLYNPHYLMSGLGLTLLMFMIFLTFENPKEYVDHDIECFNKQAYDLVLSDYLGNNFSFYIVDVTIQNYQNINSKYPHESDKLLMSSITSYLSKQYKNNLIFHPRTDSITMFIYKPSESDGIQFTDIILPHMFESYSKHFSIHKSLASFDINTVVDDIKERFEKGWFINGCNIYTDTLVNILECPKYADNPYDVHDILNYVVQSHPSDSNMQLKTCFINEDEFAGQKRYNTIYKILQDAIKDDGIEMYYQPIYSSKKKKFISAEALARLKDTDTLGYISPDEFIRVAEEKGLIIKLGDIIIDKVCRFVSETPLKEYGVKYLEVNISGIQAVDVNFPKRFMDIAKKYKVDPSFFNLEITETVAIEAMDSLKKNIMQFIDYGCTFSMDDFGTGYANIAQLINTNYMLIKFDKALIWPYFYEQDTKSSVILPNMIRMINELGCKIVAEGVETDSMVKMLIDSNVDYLQGFFYSKPIPENEYIEFLNAQN